MNRKTNSIFVLFLALVLLLPACGSKNAAATMHLVRTEGAVSVNDTDGAPVSLIENLGLYSGYGVATKAESYGWISLDEAKLAKMDEGSEVEIVKSDKLLEIHVQSGGLFFNVTEPLADDETMNIRTSTMLVGIRGTCGWVYVEGDDLMRVYLLRGKVECSVLGEGDNALASEMLTAGQMAEMTLSGDTASIIIEDFSEEDVPSFVMEEIEEDTAMIESLQPKEPDVTEPPEPTPMEDADDPAPTEDDTTPEEDVDPADENAAPADENTDTGDEDTAPADTAPAAEDIPPAAEDTTPTDENATPAVADTTPADEGATPAVEDTPLPVEDTTPAVEEPAPADDEDAGQADQPSNSDILEQYKAILAQGESYDYKGSVRESSSTVLSYGYALYQESGFSAPTLILKRDGLDINFYLLFRYDPDTGTTSQVDRDMASRFESNSYSFITDISLSNGWHSFTDTSYLESWLS